MSQRLRLMMILTVQVIPRHAASMLGILLQRASALSEATLFNSGTLALLKYTETKCIDVLVDRYSGVL